MAYTRLVKILGSPSISACVLHSPFFLPSFRQSACVCVRACIYMYVQDVDNIMETLRNLGIEFVLATLKQLQLATPNVVLRFVYSV